MKTVFGIDTEALPVYRVPEGTTARPPIFYSIPYRFSGSEVTVFWPDGSPWLISNAVADAPEVVHAFILRAFWHLPIGERISALHYWQACPAEDHPSTRFIPILDDELMTLALLEYSEAEARYRLHHRPILAAGKCLPHTAYFPISN